MAITISEAIKELEIINHDGFTITRFSEYEALNLGVEGLKRIRNNRTASYPKIAELLPGETEE